MTASKPIVPLTFFIHAYSMKPIYLPQNFYACGQTEDKNHNIEISSNFQKNIIFRVQNPAQINLF